MPIDIGVVALACVLAIAAGPIAGIHPSHAAQPQPPTPEPLAPEPLAPESLAPESLAPESLAPESPTPDGDAAAGPTPDGKSPEGDDWAGEYLDDPLAAIDSPTLEQLTEAMTDERLSLNVLSDHFPRAQSLSRDQQRQFLVEALAHPTLAVRQQAAVQLDRLGMLSEVIADRLRLLAVDADAATREIGILGLDTILASELPRDDQYIRSLVETLATGSPAAQVAATEQLRRLGPIAVPSLLDALTDPTRGKAAAVALGGIASPPMEAWPEAAAMRDGDEPSPDGRVAKTMMAPSPMAAAPPMSADGETPQAREIDPTEPTTVRVYYGTNRQIVDQPVVISKRVIALNIGVISLAIFIPALLIFAVGGRKSESLPTTSGRKPLRRWLALSAILWLVAILWSIPTLNTAMRLAYSQHQGVTFGPRRSEGGVKHYGFCDVSIPPSHQVGMVESPTFGREDEDRHVILKRTELMQQDVFFQQIRQVLESLPEPRGCFVFIHGYNVSFDSAAKRTAQIYYDLKFQGVPIFYSWPSRASVRHYFSDRNEIQYSRELIKGFLLDVAQRSGADRVHVIAHSMGADAVAGAIASMDPGEKVFDQIILAAPDIDADVFMSQIAPRLPQVSKRTTLYCSKNDWALRLSYHFNDSLRAGDSSLGPLIVPGLDTVDASSIDTELLGHSYYGNCIDILQDVEQLFLHNPDPPDRNLVDLKLDGPAWTFPRLLVESPR
jgi:esterase/lipase superfamily enzyme